MRLRFYPARRLDGVEEQRDDVITQLEAMAVRGMAQLEEMVQQLLSNSAAPTGGAAERSLVNGNNIETKTAENGAFHRSRLAEKDNKLG